MADDATSQVIKICHHIIISGFAVVVIEFEILNSYRHLR